MNEFILLNSRGYSISWEYGLSFNQDNLNACFAICYCDPANELPTYQNDTMTTDS